MLSSDHIRNVGFCNLGFAPALILFILCVILPANVRLEVEKKMLNLLLFEIIIKITGSVSQLSHQKKQEKRASAECCRGLNDFCSLA